MFVAGLCACKRMEKVVFMISKNVIILRNYTNFFQIKSPVEINEATEKVVSF
jgi:hypothetical protein